MDVSAWLKFCDFQSQLKTNIPYTWSNVITIMLELAAVNALNTEIAIFMPTWTSSCSLAIAASWFSLQLYCIVYAVLKHFEMEAKNLRRELNVV